jgi:hypothetical protein
MDSTKSVTFYYHRKNCSVNLKYAAGLGQQTCDCSPAAVDAAAHKLDRERGAKK